MFAHNNIDKTILWSCIPHIFVFPVIAVTIYLKHPPKNRNISEYKSTNHSLITMQFASI